MSARKLGRFAGLVFVLAALVGGVAAPASAAASSTAQASSATQAATLGDVVWV